MKKILYLIALITLSCVSCTTSEKQSDDSSSGITEEETVETTSNSMMSNDTLTVNDTTSEAPTVSSDNNVIDKNMPVSSNNSVGKSPRKVSTVVSEPKQEEQSPEDNNSAPMNSANEYNSQIEVKDSQIVNPSESEIAIYTVPPRAKVYLDNEYIGTSPCVVKKDSNKHKLTIDKNGYFKVDEIVNFADKNNAIYNLVKVDEKTRSIYDPRTDD